MDQRREFTGVWIPAHIIEDKRLTKTEVIIYAEIACFGICYKSNRSLGERWELKERTVSRAVSNLIDYGHLEVENKNEHRQLKALFNSATPKMATPLAKNGEAATPKMATIDNSIENSLEDNQLSIESVPLKVKPKSYKEFRDARRLEKGKLPMTPRKQTEKQKEVMQAFKTGIDYFKKVGYEQHGMQFMEVASEKRNMIVRKLVLEAQKALGDLKPLIDWWFAGAGEFAGYEPEACFSGKMIERFKNTNKKPKYFD